MPDNILTFTNPVKKNAVNATKNQQVICKQNSEKIRGEKE